MPPVDPDRWQELSPHLDRLLGMPPEECAAYLTALRAETPALADVLSRMLTAHRALADEGFLEGNAAAQVGQLALAGQTLGAYTLRSLIGQGGMSNVWLAERTDGHFQRKAAVKLLNVALAGRGEERFRREGRILGRLEHPHIAQLTDAGVSPAGQPYLVLEHVEGEPIDQYCDARTLGVEARLRLLLDVLDAVAHAHANLIVHRDLKPSNVLVSRDGRVKLLDFGIATLLDDQNQIGMTRLTREGSTALTPAFAAPEQVTGGTVTTAADVYAFGVLMYVLLTGQHPAGDSLRSAAHLVKAIVDVEPPRPSDIVIHPKRGAAATNALAMNAAARGTAPERLSRTLAGDLDVIILKTLKKDPKERYPSVTALADDLRRVLRHEPISARPDTLTYRFARFVRRNRVVVALASVALIAIAAGLVGTVTQAQRATSQASRADEEARSASAQRDFALQQLARAEAINDLTTFVFSESSKLDERFTVGELMARAEDVVERQQGTSRENRIELLVALGYQYQTIEQFTKARMVLRKAYELAGESTDAAARAKAGCALASVLGQSGEGERAEQLLRAAQEALPEGPQFALHRVYCYEMGSVIAALRGDGKGAVERAEAAQRTLTASRFDSRLLDLRISAALAAAYGYAGRWRECAALNQRAFQQIVALGREGTRMATALRNNWGNSLLALGRPLEAERLLREAIEMRSSTDEGATPIALTNLARAQRDLHRLSDAAHYAELALAKARRTGHQSGIELSLIALASIYRLQGNLSRVDPVLAQIAERLTRQPPGHIHGAALAWEQSHVAQVRGDLAAAMTAVERGIAIAEASTRRDTQLPRLLLRRSEVAHATGLADRAVVDADAALQMEQKKLTTGEFSNQAGQCYLALGRARQQQGRMDDAQAAFNAAVLHLRSAVGEEHPATRSAMQLASPSSGRASPDRDRSRR